MIQSSPPLIFEVPEEANGARLDRFLRDTLPKISGGALRHLIDGNRVRVDDASARKGSRVRAGQRVSVAIATTTERPLPQAERPLDILDVTPAIIAINKPPGMPSHPLLPGELGTVANALLARFPECGDASDSAREGGLVHRLDWGTSGVLLAARSRAAYQRLRGLFSGGAVIKRYLALVNGVLEKAQTVDLPLRTRAGDRRRVSIAKSQDKGQPAHSEIETLAVLQKRYTLVTVRCATGRRHQVRVHLAALGHPIVGDDLYGGPPLPPEGDSLANFDASPGAFLHAASVTLGNDESDGISGENVFGAPLPAGRRAILTSLGYTEARKERLEPWAG